MARLLLVRHAQSEWNLLGRWQGWADPPLSLLGLHQAERAGRRLAPASPAGNGPGPLRWWDDGPRRIISSDLQRARTTARLVARHALADGARRGGEDDAGVAVDADLREYRVGQWSGLTRAEIEQSWPGLLDRWDQGDLTTPPGGEDRGHFESRLFRALDRVATTQGSDGCALVVSHGGAIRAIARRLRSPLHRVGNLAGVAIEGADGRYACAGTIDLLDDPGEAEPTGA